MIRIIRIASAFIGIIVGAGFASGQEVLQYFTSFGLMGTIGAFISTVLFAYAGMILVWIGSREKKNSHKEVIHLLSGRFLGTIIDYILIFTLFGVGVVMIAGAGSNLEQQFNMPYFVGTTLMTFLVLITGMLRVNRVVSVIGSITPFLILFIVLISIYSLYNFDTPLTTLETTASTISTTLPNWFISSINYVSFNVAVGASMGIVMGSAEKDRKVAALGGLLGGAGIGVLILLSHLAIYSNIEMVGQMDMPLLGIVNNISPLLGFIMSIVIFGMIYNTAISMFFSFAARFVEVETKKFKIFFLCTLIIGYIASFIGFTDLVAYFYPLIGYLGLVLFGLLVVTPFLVNKQVKLKEKL